MTDLPDLANEAAFMRWVAELVAQAEALPVGEAQEMAAEAA